MSFYFSKLILLSILLLVLAVPNFFVFGEDSLTKICEEICQSETKPSELTEEDYRKVLEQCKEYYEKKSEEIAKEIAKTGQEKTTLQNEISLLRNKIGKLENEIYQSNLIIQDLGLQIKDTQTSIEKTSLKIEDSQEKLVNVLRTIYEEDQKSIIEVLLLEARLSDFFNDLVALEALSAENKELLGHIKDLKLNLQNEKEALNNERQDLEKVVVMRSLQKQENASTKQKQENLLKMTEAEYQKYLKEKEETEKRATEIKARIFELIGVPKAPTFGEAYELAKYIESVTGVRPALLLAVLTQESNIGKNVGQCYVTNLQTGAGVNIRTGAAVKNVMKPMGLSGRKGDTDAFLLITGELGRKWNETPVSCPIPSVGGYGGAMGPAQFIPTTWMAYKNRVAEIVNKNPDPWDIKDSFLAAALYLADYGAAKQTYDSEWRAAMIYFSGTTNAKYKFYGDSVIAITKQYEEDIKALEKAD